MKRPRRKPKFRVGQVVRVWRPTGSPTGSYEFKKIKSYIDDGRLIRFKDGTLQFPNLCLPLTAREKGNR